MLNPTDELIVIQQGLQLLKDLFEDHKNAEKFAAFTSFIQNNKSVQTRNLFNNYDFTEANDKAIFDIITALTPLLQNEANRNLIAEALARINGQTINEETLRLLSQLVTLQQARIAARLAAQAASDVTAERPQKTWADLLRNFNGTFVGEVVSKAEESTEQQADTANTNIDSDPERPLSAYMKPVAAVVTATVGLGMTSLAALIQFNAHVSATFSLLVGATLPVSALIAAAVAGVVLMGLAGYLAYQSFYQTPVVPVAPVTPEITAPVVASEAADTKDEDKGSCFQRACPSFMSMFSKEKKDEAKAEPQAAPTEDTVEDKGCFSRFQACFGM